MIRSTLDFDPEDSPRMGEQRVALRTISTLKRWESASNMQQNHYDSLNRPLLT